MLSEENRLAIEIMYHELDMSPTEIAANENWPYQVMLKQVFAALGLEPLDPLLPYSLHTRAI